MSLVSIFFQHVAPYYGPQIRCPDCGAYYPETTCEKVLSEHHRGHVIERIYEEATWFI